MNQLAAQIPSDPEQLREAFVTLQQDYRELQRLVDYLQTKPFRRSAETYEGMTPLITEAGDTAEEPEDQEPPPPRTRVEAHDRKKPVRKALPDEMPREVVRHELPESERRCNCGHDLHEIGVEATEQLDIVPAKVRVLRHERVKYGCRSCGDGVKTAVMPKQPLPKSFASPATLAHVAVAKYADALPLYRQEAMWSRLGVQMDRGTLSTWMVKAGELLHPIVTLLKEDIIRDGIVHCDETPHQVLDKEQRKKNSERKNPSLGYMWVLSRSGPGPRATVFSYDRSRSGKVARRLLDGFHGIAVTDGYVGYNGLAKSGITRAACWAHVRRKFLDAVKIEGKETRATVAHRMMTLIRRLYAVEKTVAISSPDERHSRRQEISPRIMAKIEALLDANIARVPPKSPTGKALQYLSTEWIALQVFLRDGRVPLDNNLVENAIRPFAIGRKNWLFSVSTGGAESSANFYSLIETAKANGLDPHAYLRRVFTDLPNATTLDDIERLLPYPPKH